MALFLYKITSDYGESPFKVLVNSVCVLLLFTFIVFGLGIAASDIENKYTIASLINSAYYSVITFTTLGYGDIYPKSHWGQLTAGILALLGLFYSSLFMVSVVRKYSRN